MFNEIVLFLLDLLHKTRLLEHAKLVNAKLKLVKNMQMIKLILQYLIQVQYPRKVVLTLLKLKKNIFPVERK